MAKQPSTIAGRNHVARTVQKIRSAGILDRLIAFFCDDDDPVTGKKAGDWSLSAAQVRVGLTLIGKYVPDLKAIEQTINDRRSNETQDSINDKLYQLGFGKKEIEQVWRNQIRH